MNVFDAVMKAEWNRGDHRRSDEFYQRWGVSADGNWSEPQSEWWFISDVVEGLQVWIRCPGVYDSL
ncbi:MAG: hypothetical protein LBJ02_07280, partial [Bifidobacteriaceae bacterium]|nr:hypothetical protein [Bifidobacteriaceae bacterium]